MRTNVEVKIYWQHLPRLPWDPEERVSVVVTAKDAVVVGAIEVVMSCEVVETVESENYVQ